MATEYTDTNKPLKIIVVGESGAGKTTFTKLISCHSPDSTPRYIKTVGVSVHRFKVSSIDREFNIDLWDTHGQEKFGVLRDGYYIGAAGAICLVSASDLRSFRNWIKDVRRVCSDIPIALCISKMDLQPDNAFRYYVNRIAAVLRFASKNNIMVCEMSSYAKFGVHEPLTWILQKLAGNDTLELTFPPLMSDLQAKIEPEIMKAAIFAHKKMLRRHINDIEDDFDDNLSTAGSQHPSTGVSNFNENRQVLEIVTKSCSPRVKNVMEALLTGVRTGPVLSTRKHHPLQQPSLLFVEGLECQEFHTIEKFNFVQPLLEFYKQHEDAIIMETKGLMGLSGLDDMTSSVNGSWKSFYFVESGQINHTSAETAPLLTHMLRGVSSLMTCSFGYAYISILGPHSHITPHCGPCNIKLRCNLPLIVPSEGCTIRVGSTTKSFKQGELLIFDDSIEHEVRNDSSDTPTVHLVFDIWHPDLTPNEIDSFKLYFKR